MRAVARTRPAYQAVVAEACFGDVRDCAGQLLCKKKRSKRAVGRASPEHIGASRGAVGRALGRSNKPPQMRRGAQEQHGCLRALNLPGRFNPSRFC